MPDDVSGIERLRVELPVADVLLRGDVAIPRAPKGMVLFAHGSGSSRHSPRNRYVANVLNEVSLGTLLADLLTVDEEQEDDVTAELRFNIPLLTRRLTEIAGWLKSETATHTLGLGLFGASTGAAAALLTAADRPDLIKAVVSRGGRPDLAGQAVSLVRAPTLLIVGGNDKAVLRMNEQARASMNCVRELKIVSGASHLFEEPGALQQVAELASEWFIQNLPPESVQR
jgi:pimeloyl-ACP methyl ester carboxylesterase